MPSTSGSARGNDLVGVDRHVGGLARHVLDELLHGGHTGGAADEDDLVEVGELEAGVAQSARNRLLAALEQVVGDALELSAGDGVVEVLGAGGVGGDEREVHVSLLGGGELLLGVLGSLLQALQRHGVLTQVDAVVGLELVGQPGDDALIPVVAAQVVVASGGENLEHAVGQVEDRDVERAAAEVEDEDLLLGGLLVEAVGKSRSSGLVDDTLDVETGDLAGVLGCLTLRVVEVGRDGDDGVGNGLAQVLLGVGLHLLKDHGADLLGREVLAVNVHDGTAALAVLDVVRDRLDLLGDLAVLTAHKALDGEDGVLRVGDGLVLSRLADHAVAVGTEANDRRSGTVALGVNDNGGLPAFEHGHRRVGRTQVNAQDLVAHCGPLSLRFLTAARVSAGVSLCTLLTITVMSRPIQNLSEFI